MTINDLLVSFAQVLNALKDSIILIYNGFSQTLVFKYLVYFMLFCLIGSLVYFIFNNIIEKVFNMVGDEIDKENYRKKNNWF